MSYCFDAVGKRFPAVLARDGPDLAAEEDFPGVRFPGLVAAYAATLLYRKV